MTDTLLEQCINIKFCTKLGKSMSVTLQMLTEACGVDAMKKLSVLHTYTLLHSMDDILHRVASKQ
jgi:hypothetical protein